jgi:hypothetical protein
MGALSMWLKRPVRAFTASRSKDKNEPNYFYCLYTPSWREEEQF